VSALHLLRGLRTEHYDIGVYLSHITCVCRDCSVLGHDAAARCSSSSMLFSSGALCQ
jgi:hypothetical protein